MSDRLVIARFKENLNWLLEIPEEIEVYVYNKGDDDLGDHVPGRCKVFEKRKNFGRESETYLHHMIEVPSGDPDRFTIFCQGDPFEHSPDFLSLLNKRAMWRDVQALSYCWSRDQDIPPAELMQRETAQWIDGCRIRTEVFSLHSWNAVGFHDPGTVRQLASYLGANDLSNGANVAGHFFQSVGWEALSDAAAQSSLGEFSYGAIFGVRNELLKGVPPDVLRSMKSKTRQHALYPYIFERLWLHIFGLPFLRVQKNGNH